MMIRNENTKIAYQTSSMSAWCSWITDVWGAIKPYPLKTVTTTYRIPPTSSVL